MRQTNESTGLGYLGTGLEIRPTGFVLRVVRYGCIRKKMTTSKSHMNTELNKPHSGTRTSIYASFIPIHACDVSYSREIHEKIHFLKPQPKCGFGASVLQKSRY
jgi:hypothetical protein